MKKKEIMRKIQESQESQNRNIENKTKLQNKCYWCNKPGHLKRECPVYLRQGNE